MKAAIVVLSDPSGLPSLQKLVRGGYSVLTF